jgi:hypothetical protein
VSTSGEPSGVLWDTMFASRLRPTRPELLAAALSARGTAHEPLLGASVVSEVVYGLRKGAVADPKYAALAIWWESHILGGPDRLRVATPRVEALIVAARVLALQPTSPARATRKDDRKDPERRLSWCRDVELAALGATLGLPVASANRADFEPIGELLDRVAPGRALKLVDAPFG